MNRRPTDQHDPTRQDEQKPGGQPGHEAAPLTQGPPNKPGKQELEDGTVTEAAEPDGQFPGATTPLADRDKSVRTTRSGGGEQNPEGSENKSQSNVAAVKANR